MLYAHLLTARKGVSEAERRAAWKDAVDNVEKDGLSDVQRAYVLQRYRVMTKGATRVAVDLALLKLANAGNELGRFKHWLNALEVAVTQVKNRPLAQQVVGLKPAGKFVGDDAARRDRLLQAYEKLPKSN